MARTVLMKEMKKQAKPKLTKTSRLEAGNLSKSNFGKRSNAIQANITEAKSSVLHLFY
jgi:hypothetical protein